MGRKRPGVPLPEREVHHLPAAAHREREREKRKEWQCWGEIDRWMNRRTRKGQTDGYRDRCADGQIDTQTNREAHRWTGWRADRQLD